jgi:hypothetical protein
MKSIRRHDEEVEDETMSEDDVVVEETFEHALSFDICARCMTHHGTEEERSSFFGFIKSHGDFYCPASITEKHSRPTAGRLDVNSLRPPDWCPYFTEHAVSK